MGLARVLPHPYCARDVGNDKGFSPRTAALYSLEPQRGERKHRTRSFAPSGLGALGYSASVPMHRGGQVLSPLPGLKERRRKAIRVTDPPGLRLCHYPHLGCNTDAEASVQAPYAGAVMLRPPFMAVEASGTRLARATPWQARSQESLDTAQNRYRSEARFFLRLASSSE